VSRINAKDETTVEVSIGFEVTKNDPLATNLKFLVHWPHEQASFYH
jgi:hypothetical protein